MYEDFQGTDRWTGETLHCRWKANIVAIATRHADAVDVRFDVNDKPMWIAMPLNAWVEQKKRTGKVITDGLAAQTAGHYLKSIIEEGYDASREMYTMNTEEVLEHLGTVLEELKISHVLPTLPILNGHYAGNFLRSHPQPDLMPNSGQSMPMDKTIRIVTDFEQQQAGSDRYRNSLTVGQRLSAVWDASEAAYAFAAAFKGSAPDDACRSQRVITRVQRSKG